jgi:hypothetical protein
MKQINKGYALVALALIAGAASAQQQQQPDWRQADPRVVEYATALSFDLQLQNQQRFCATDPQARASYEAGLRAFRARNPDFIEVLRTPPTSKGAAEAIASVQDLIKRIEPAALEGMRSTGVVPYCQATAQALPTLSWANMKQQAGLQ